MDGILLINKEKGISSFQTIGIVKKNPDIKKIGHSGTLDPAAEGLLLALVNKATKINDYMHNLSKVYELEIKFGAQTDTDDTEGKIIKECGVPEGLEGKIRAALPDFTGEIMQKPPVYSAINKDGKKLYELAREGKKVDPEPRKVSISEIEIISVKPPLASLRVTCSTGTYMRSLARDLGEKTGSCAMLNYLKRTKIGKFTLDNAAKAADIKELKNHLIPIKDALYEIPPVELNAKQAEMVRNGNVIKHDTCAEKGIIKLMHEDKVIAIGSVWGGIIKVKRGI